MRRRGLPVGVLLVLLLILSLAGRATSKDRNKPPNIVFILIDDMGYGDIGPFGQTQIRTPNLDRMAREGMRLTSFYGCPVCTPSRAQCMTGCYAQRVSLPRVLFPAEPIGLSSEERTVADLLKERGYATFCAGKWHLGDQPAFLPTRHGFDSYLGLPYSNDMGKRPMAPAGSPASKYPPLPLVRNEEVIEAPADQDQLVRRYTEETQAFIRKNRDHPFFAYLPHTAVHVPLHPGPNFRGRSALGMYGDWVEEVDWSVGQVLDTVRELNLDRQTLVFFTSDNGPWLTQGKNGGSAGPLRGGKASTWEGGMREPTIAWWPGRVPAGASCDALAVNFDLLPTFVKLAGGRLPRERKIDGADIWSLLSGKSRKTPHDVFYYYNVNRLEAVRSGPWKLRLPGARGDGTGTQTVTNSPELYNLEADLSERTDVSAQHPKEVARLEGLAAEMEKDLGRTAPGPGVRPPGKVTDPHPLLRRDSIEYD